jgi:hypothetical protein
MLSELSFTATPEQAKDELWLRNRIRAEVQTDAFTYRWKKRSIDARKPQIKINCLLEIFAENESVPPRTEFYPRVVTNAPEVAIIGAGPAGLFAGLRALELGFKPVLFERGKDVRSRRRDLATLNREGVVNPESNYCFGEGGAGTYSDGKLYTRSKKRGDVQKALEWFVHFGAHEDILVDAHPHIGTNKLPAIIVAMREEIIRAGGEVHFETKITDLEIEQGALTGLEINGKEKRKFSQAILATGHSARDVFEMLYRNGLEIKAKPFALGVRIEHPQDLIDKIQYHGRVNDDFLPPASYSLVAQVKDRGVYSFCMCPGGIVAPCATADGEVVTNGWSPSKRNNPYANSGIVVSLQPSDCGDPKDPFACLDYQRAVEKACWEAGGKNQQVPAQRLLDFLDGKVSESLPISSYQPGLVSVDLNTILPPLIAQSLKEAFREFGRKMKGFLTNEAVLHAPESRTSSPIQIPRDEAMQHPQLEGLYPCAEGAGYAGGIISAGIDGMKCVEAIATKLSAESSK